MSPTAQLTTSLAVLIPVVAASVAVLFFFTDFWWLVFFGWALFPAFALLLRGIAGLSEGESRKGLRGSNDGERELLGALREHDEITPTRAAMETSLTVAEADGMLKDLAAKGHLEARVRGAESSTASGRRRERRGGVSRRGSRCRGGGRSCYHSVPGRGLGA